MNATRFANEFSEKIIFCGDWVILDLKMGHLHNFGSALRNFLKFCTMKGAKSYMEIMAFLKKNSHLEQIGHFRPKNRTCS